jgi:hypothetical protein
MRDSFTVWSEILLRERNTLLVNMVRPLKYEKHIWTAVADLLDLRTSIARDYLDGWKELDYNKTKLWDKKDRKKWELDPRAVSRLDPKYLDDERIAKKLILAEETRVMKNLQNVFGYVNTKLKQEF